MKEDIKRFVYYNREPLGKHKKDCVCRAISTATGLKYSAVERLLNLTSEFYQCEKLCLNCYHNLLEDLFGYPVIYCKKGEKVKDLAETYSNKRLIIRVKGHLTCSIMGNILDIWDCSDELVDCFWIVE